MPKAKTNSENKETKKVIDHEIEVLRAKFYNDVYFFDFNCNGVAIYGCRFIQNKDGNWFVAFPSRKDGDKYWHHVYVALSEKDIDSIDKQIDTLLEN
jgi:hypothetical protein